MASVVWIFILAYVAAMVVLFIWLIRTQPAAMPRQDQSPPPQSGKDENRASPLSGVRKAGDADTEPYQKPGPWY